MSNSGLSSTSRMWMTMATHGYSHNGSKTDLTMFCYKGPAQPKVGKSGGSVAALAPLRICVGSYTPVYLIVVGDYGYKTKSSQQKLKRMQKGKV